MYVKSYDARRYCLNIPSSSYICSCAEGYRGQNCTVDVNECDAVPSPCKNGASCTNTYGTYLCRCKAGYTGKGAGCLTSIIRTFVPRSFKLS